MTDTGNLFPIAKVDPNETLRKLAANPENALELGKAAEHLVAADLILQGYRCFLSDQGLPYDLVVDMAGQLIRLQCKACCFPRNVNADGRTKRIAYGWAVRRRGMCADCPNLSRWHAAICRIAAHVLRCVGPVEFADV